jgi:hypothetical protein
VRERNLPGRYVKHFDYQSPGGIDGTVTISEAMGKRLEVGGAALDQPMLELSRTPLAENGLRDGLGLMRHIKPRAAAMTSAGLLGLGFLLRHKLFFDIDRQRLVLEPPTRPLLVPPPAWRTIGLVLDKPEHDFFVVFSVIEGTPAAQAGMARGERIVSVERDERERPGSIRLCPHAGRRAGDA